MATGTAGNQARSQARQVANTWRKQINWNDANNGINVPAVVVPQGSFIARVMCEIVNAFDGAASLLMGANAGANNIIASGDVNEAATGLYEATRGYGRSLTAAGDTALFTRLTSSGGTVGQAEVLMIYEANTG